MGEEKPDRKLFWGLQRKALTVSGTILPAKEGYMREK